MRYVLGFFLILFIIEMRGQEVEVSFGISTDLNYKLRSKASKSFYPSIRAHIGVSYRHTITDEEGMNRCQFNASSSLVIYNKSLGNSVNKDFQDNQIDWTSHAGLSYLYGFASLKKLQTINNTYLYNIIHNADYAFSLGSNFIINNHNRNQSIGYLTGTVKNVSFMYYNDGPPFSYMGMSDAFDRYWTGGGKLFYHTFDEESNLAFNKIEFSYDQFTGYTPDLYELSGILGADLQDYDLYDRIDQAKNSSQNTGVDSSRVRLSFDVQDNNGYDYNASRYEVQYSVNPHFQIKGGIRGSLRDDKADRYYGVQDWIHIRRGDPVHPTVSENLLFFGMNYNNKL